MSNRIAVLDHGFVHLRNLSGPTRRVDASIVLGDEIAEVRPFDADDIDPASTARISFDNLDADRTREDDLKLAEYLLKNRHTTPFEMIEVWFEMKMPIFIARQFVRHRTCSINEVSARYVQLPSEWYIPKRENVGLRPKNMKQGRSQLSWDELTLAQRDAVERYLWRLDADCKRSYDHYQQALDDDIPPELARCHLHLNHYTWWVWKQDLHNLMHFLALRVDSHAQWEAQQYGNAMVDLVRQHLPHSMALFDKYRRL